MLVLCLFAGLTNCQRASRNDTVTPCIDWTSDRFGIREPFRADFVHHYLEDVKEVVVPNGATIDAMRKAHLKQALHFVPPGRRWKNRNALYLEFGVADGESIRYMAHLTGPNITWHGFDSFQGLPATNMSGTRSEQVWRKGDYTQKGHFPTNIPENVRFHKGWYSETFPPFLDASMAKHDCIVAFVHLDAGIINPPRHSQDRMC